MLSRRFVSYPADDLHKIKQQVLSWSARFDTCCFLDSQQYGAADQAFECAVAAGAVARLEAAAGTAFRQLRQFADRHNDWLFGHFSYSLRSETESVAGRLPDRVGFPDLFFFVPETMVLLNRDRLSIGSLGKHPDEIWEDIRHMATGPEPEAREPLSVRPRMQKAAYLDTVRKLKAHIARGDCYEINFCQEFFAEQADISPLALFRALSRSSPSPFSAYYTTGQKYLLCASPERYLQRRGDRILSQPIKGTASRDIRDARHDEQLKQELFGSAKDRAENVMIVDLVRNDLSRICRPDTVKVEELFGIYAFAQVHQMISTVAGNLKPGLHWTDMIAKTFPMGSMTGAPKKRVLELTEQYEGSERGLYSGALGYVKPGGDFDFNVVIRSILYNRPARYLAYFAGSGITAGSDPEKEYEECLVKVAAMEQILKSPAR